MPVEAASRDGQLVAYGPLPGDLGLLLGNAETLRWVAGSHSAGRTVTLVPANGALLAVTALS